MLKPLYAVMLSVQRFCSVWDGVKLGKKNILNKSLTYYFILVILVYMRETKRLKKDKTMVQFTFINLMSGERHPVIQVDLTNPYHIFITDGDNFQQGKNFTTIANGHSRLVDEQQNMTLEEAGNWNYQWRLYSPTDSMNEYVKSPVREDVTFWEALESILNTLPQPSIDEKRKSKELSAGLRHWQRGWNEDNKGSGQAYMGV